ncbi:MAG TPA: nitrate ABC transporter, permease protein, partial [Burkholderiales bacterium]|nr:nitrate ABC transporter, permease protein [Burkholderiales bacterium]
MPGKLGLRAALVSLFIFALGLAIWHVATLPVEKAVNADPEYAKMVGSKSSGLPSPAMIARTIWTNVTDPFYDHGPNDKGIGIQLAYSM